MGGKRAEVRELVKIIIAVLVLVIMVAVILVLFKGGGGKILDSIKNIFRFGR
jgi:hypothetical protein